MVIVMVTRIEPRPNCLIEYSPQTCGAILGDVAEVDSLREYRGVVVDVLKVNLDIGVTHESFSTFVLGKHGEPPLRSTIWLISVQRLRGEKGESHGDPLRSRSNSSRIQRATSCIDVRSLLETQYRLTVPIFELFRRGLSRYCVATTCTNMYVLQS